MRLVQMDDGLQRSRLAVYGTEAWVVLVEEKLIYAQFEIFDHFSPTVFSMTRATHSWTDVSSAATTIRRRR